jgi:DNA polymerase-3 subunit epsilon
VKDEPSLVRRAVLVLQERSAHTLELAREVLGLKGNAGAASAAVFALLGTDPRFEVDGSGWWTLVGEAPAVADELDALQYAVVDVETTGGSPDRGHRITEIAVVEVRDGIISEDFQTLVNPGRSIPPRISELTGITEDMVAGAPFFDEIAEDLFEWLEGRVFVAHNASFDWRFVHHELTGTLGYAPSGPRLCTVQLARRLAPQLARRDLDSLAAHFGVPIHSRHRAYGDALATARVLLRLLDEATAQGVRDLTSLQLLLTRRSRGP